MSCECSCKWLLRVHHSNGQWYAFRIAITSSPIEWAVIRLQDTLSPRERLHKAPVRKAYLVNAVVTESHPPAQELQYQAMQGCWVTSNDWSGSRWTCRHLKRTMQLHHMVAWKEQWPSGYTDRLQFKLDRLRARFCKKTAELKPGSLQSW